MNISHDGTTVSFKTEPEEVFLAEKSGAKSNTVRIVDNDEYERLNMHTPKKIIIRYKQELFLRTLTNLYFAKLFGNVLVIFSWEHPKKHPHSDHVHVTTEPDLHSPLSHSMRLDDEPYSASLPGPHSVPFEQGAHSVGLQQEVETPAEMCETVEEPSIDTRFAEITISNGTLALLQSLAHGRTMNRVIKELYKRYMCAEAKEKVALHD